MQSLSHPDFSSDYKLNWTKRVPGRLPVTPRKVKAPSKEVFYVPPPPAVPGQFGPQDTLTMLLLCGPSKCLDVASWPEQLLCEVRA